MSLLRSLLFSTPLIALATVVMGTLSLLASLFDRTGRTQHRLARMWGRMLLGASFIRVRTEGLEKLDPNATYVFVANHSSYMDIPALLAYLPFQFRFFAKKGLYQIPFLGGHLKRAGHIPVDRSSARASLKSMTEGARIVDQRRVSVLLFPEGGRCPEGLREFKEGAAYIAIKAGVPVVPMAIVGMRRLLPMGSIHLRSGEVALRVGDPIPTAGMGLHARTALNKRLYQEVSQLLAGGAPKLVG
ncbi:MAG: lysophospholipid acyltransferase family protein [Bryobacteraceae bacterium]